jgi:hypothetical protein
VLNIINDEKVEGLSHYLLAIEIEHEESGLGLAGLTHLALGRFMDITLHITLHITLKYCNYSSCYNITSASTSAQPGAGLAV